jgi:hypothetical protein
MRKFFNFIWWLCCLLMVSKYLVLNPSMKLQYIPAEKHDEAKALLRRTVCWLYYSVLSLN